MTLSKKRFMSLVRSAAKDYRPDWRVGASGVSRRDDSGCWAHIWFFENRGPPPQEPEREPYRAQVIAGVVHPYLLRTYNGKEIKRGVPPNFIGAHAALERGDLRVWFDPDGEHEGAPYELGPSKGFKRVDLDEASAATQPRIGAPTRTVGWSRRASGSRLEVIGSADTHRIGHTSVS